MSSHRYIFSSESVTEGHPDKMADQISDAILDRHLAADPLARVACETLVTTGMVVLAGEITSTATVNTPEVVRETIREIGYTDGSHGFDADTCAVLTASRTWSTTTRTPSSQSISTWPVRPSATGTSSSIS